MQDTNATIVEDSVLRQHPIRAASNSEGESRLPGLPPEIINNIARELFNQNIASLHLVGKSLYLSRPAEECERPPIHLRTPPEIVNNIARELDDEDTVSLLRIDKELYDRTKYAFEQLFLKHVHVFLHPTSFDKLQHLVNDPFYACAEWVVGQMRLLGVVNGHEGHIHTSKGVFSLLIKATIVLASNEL
ncbi:hypothetical protein P171DRAFT_483956 [Karstenula rhodostoma CBS 690.94]|uniref:Uncharacterized protein n=1 Tax=Karstenula rhodostoma CBS 690.94 TaxID=1392251 RepID=A0A9P4PNR5_9PLEO|nr:hypothetical protein P171DRAFT_483956 [Karstenula rhodostoma CBS 690.94]